VFKQFEPGHPRYIFVALNVTGRIYELLLVFFFINCMSSACLLYEMQCIENSWMRVMIEILTLKHVQLQQLHNVVYSPDATVKCWAAKFHRGRESIEDERWPRHPFEASCLQRKLSCC